eukprot:scaffold268395_cov42-Prasinocladus_malaysianus.AAC.2
MGGEPFQLSTLTYNPATDSFFASNNNMDLYTMTRTGKTTKIEDVNLRSIRVGSAIPFDLHRPGDMFFFGRY